MSTPAVKPVAGTHLITPATDAKSPFMNDHCNECGKAKELGEVFYVDPRPHGLHQHAEGGVTTTYAHQRPICGSCYRVAFKVVNPNEDPPV